MDYQSEPVVVTPIDGGFRVAIKGAVHTNVQWLEHELADVVAAAPKRVELDLAGTDFVSSTGLGTFVKFHRDLTAAGAILQVVAIREAVLRTFRYARLDVLFNIDPSAVVAAR